MKRALAAALAVCVMAQGASAQGARLTPERLAELETLADRIAQTETGSVPDLLVRATLAVARMQGERPLAEQIAGMNLLTSMRTLERQANVAALRTFLEVRLSPADLARLYATSVYYGRNCFGYVNAAHGLADQSPEEADDALWLALAALPRSPTWYLRDRVALKARVARIVEALEQSALVNKRTAERLDDQPIANLDAGKGCTN